MSQKIVVLSGASGGLGLAMLQSFDRNSKYRFICISRQKSTDLEAALRSRDQDPETNIFYLDLTKTAETALFAKNVQERWGSPWALINLAGMSHNDMFWKLSPETFAAVLQANLHTTFNLCREFVPALRGSGGGRIINISSVTAATGVIGASAYVTAKAAIEGLTRNIAVETANKGVTANTIALGYFDYGMIKAVPAAHLDEIRKKIPMARLGKIEELNHLFSYLLDEGSAYVTGQTFHLNGGLQLS